MSRHDAGIASIVCSIEFRGCRAFKRHACVTIITSIYGKHSPTPGFNGPIHCSEPTWKPENRDRHPYMCRECMWRTMTEPDTQALRGLLWCRWAGGLRDWAKHHLLTTCATVSTMLMLIAGV